MNKIISWLLVVIWLIVIFYFSSMNSMESNGKSKGILYDVVNKVVYISNNMGITKNISDSDINNIVDKLNLPLRKCMHMLEYLILSILLLNALKYSNVVMSKSYVVAVILCIVFSSIDEFHQYFVEGRTSSIKDVFIDNIGTTSGLIIYYIIGR